MKDKCSMCSKWMYAYEECSTYSSWNNQYVCSDCMVKAFGEKWEMR